jgi:hypothetical protein
MNIIRLLGRTAGLDILNSVFGVYFNLYETPMF